MQVIMGKVDEGLVAAYTERTGIDSKEIIKFMDAETWFTAEEAGGFGFADSVNSVKKQVKAEKKWNLSAYKNAPETKNEEKSIEITDTIEENSVVYIEQEHRDRQVQRLKMLATLNDHRLAQWKPPDFWFYLNER